MKGHALFDAGEKDGEEYLLWAKKYLYLSNNLYSLYIYLQEKQKELQMYANTNNSNNNSSSKSGKLQGAGGGFVGVESLRSLLQLADTVEAK